MAQYGLAEYPPDYQTNPYCIEYARSGRATCQGCKELIEKGDLRIGSPVQFPEQDISYKWRHFRCLTSTVLSNMRSKAGRHGQDVAITGLDKLRAQDRRRVAATLGEQGLAAAKGDSSEEEEGGATSGSEEEAEEEEEVEEEQPQPQKKKKGGKKKAAEDEEAAEHKPAPTVKTPKKRAPTKRAPRLAAKRRAQEDSDEDYQPGKQARGRRAAK